MATNETSAMKSWVLEALKDNGGRAPLLDIARHIWQNHEKELRASETLFLTWQYRMRWAATALRKEGKLHLSAAGEPWRLKT